MLIVAEVENLQISPFRDLPVNPAPLGEHQAPKWIRMTIKVNLDGLSEQEAVDALGLLISPRNNGRIKLSL